MTWVKNSGILTWEGFEILTSGGNNERMTWGEK